MTNEIEELKYENICVQIGEMQLYCVTELQGIFVCTSAYSVVFCSQTFQINKKYSALFQ